MAHRKCTEKKCYMTSHTKLLHTMPNVTDLQFPPPPPKKKKNYSPEIQHGTWKWWFPKGISFSNLVQGLRNSGSMLNFGGVPPPNSIPFFFLTSPRFQPKNGPRDVDKALMQKINSVGCASSRRFISLESPKRRFLGRGKFSAGRNTHGFSGRCGKSHEFCWSFFWGKSMPAEISLFFFEIKLLENNSRCCAGLQCLIFGGQIWHVIFFLGQTVSFREGTSHMMQMLMMIISVWIEQENLYIEQKVIVIYSCPGIVSWNKCQHRVVSANLFSTVSQTMASKAC